MTRDDMRTLNAYKPAFAATAVFVGLLVLIGPWANLPLNDDWQYAHFAKSLAEHGSFPTDVTFAPTVVGQSAMAWPVLKLFGFSHLALRLLTILVSIGLLFEIDYLLAVAAVSGRVRFLTLCAIVANPLFLHLSTTFMTENYAYFFALLSACLWLGDRNGKAWKSALAGALAGTSFWIRQFGAFVLPALLIAEWLSSGASMSNGRSILKKRAVAIGVWVLIIAGYFPWATARGLYTTQFSSHIAQTLSPSPVVLLFQAGVFVFYLTFFLAPLVVCYGIPRKPSLKSSIFIAALGLTAAFAWIGGVKNGPPSATLNSTFPFLNNIFRTSGIGAVTLSDVYWGRSRVVPRIPSALWTVLELLTIVIGVAWGNFVDRAKKERSAVGIFGITLAVLTLVVTLLAYRDEIFDRYHYAGLIGFAIALAVFFPREKKVPLAKLTAVWIGALALFSVVGVRDYFRWNEARSMLLAEATANGIALSDVDGGFEPNGWNSLENNASSPSCGAATAWFCAERTYRIRITTSPADSVLASRPARAWLARFPDLELTRKR